MTRAVIPSASHQHAIPRDTRTGELLFAACTQTASDTWSQFAAYSGRPVADHQFGSRHSSPPCHDSLGQCPPRYISSRFAAYHLGHPYNGNWVSSSSLHYHAIGHYANWSFGTASSYCQSASPDDTGSTPFNRCVEPLLDQRIHRAGSSQVLCRDGGTHPEDPRGPSTHQEESPT